MKKNGRQEVGVGIASPRTPLVGRDDEVGRVVELVRRREVRLVTITGRGGVGKTVLADEVARRLVVLDPVSVEKLRMNGRSGPVGLESLLEALNGRSGKGAAASDAPPGRTRIVVLDGFEVVPEAAPTVSAALDADPDLTVLVTSITPLSLRGEHLVRVEPLPLPALDERDPRAALATPAVGLVCERIAAVDPSFELTAERTRVVVELCTRLEGLPLALELAAARCASMPVEAVLEQLNRSSPLSVLTTGPVDAEARHRSLRATILWSYEFLDAPSQALLRRLGVFAGSFSWEAMAAVADDADDDGLTDHVAGLVVTGLLRYEPSGDGMNGPRYSLSPTVRQMALELLADGGELDAWRRRHAHYYRDLAARAAMSVWSADGTRVRRELFSERQDLLEAVEFVHANGDLCDSLRLVVDLQPLWMESGASATVGRLLHDLLDHVADRAVPDDLVAAAWVCAANLAFWSGSAPEGTEDLAERLDWAIDRARRLGETDLLLRAIETKVESLLAKGSADLALASASEGCASAETAEDDWWRARFLSWSAAAANKSGDPKAALDLAVASRTLARGLGDERQDLWSSMVLLGINGAFERPETPDPADVLELARRLGEELVEGLLMTGVAARYAADANVTAAAEVLRAALSLGIRTGQWAVEEFVVLTLVLTSLAGGRTTEAVRLHGALSTVLPDLRKRMPPQQVVLYEFMIEGARREIGDQEFDALVAGGRLLGWSQTLSYAGEVLNEIVAANDASIAGVESTPTSLTDRELEVLRLIAAGGSNKEIAAELGLRPKTVMHHSSHIYRKLGVRSRAEAATEAWRLGLLGDRVEPV